MSNTAMMTLANPRSQDSLQNDASKTESLNPPLKWAGGKRWLLPHLEPIWKKHRHRRLVEPFCGGLAVSLGLLPRKALLNDINLHLINFYKWLQRGLAFTLPMVNQVIPYYEHRERFNTLIREERAHSKEAAELFYYLNRTSYNGLCRFNRSGEFNVPFGRYKNITYKSNFISYQPIVSRWVFQSKDFERLNLNKDDFIYADPPYDVEFTHYAKEDFHWEDQERLAEWLIRHPGPIVLSNQATPRVLKLYKSLGFRVRILSAPRRISCNGDRTPAEEVIATRNL